MKKYEPMYKVNQHTNLELNILIQIDYIPLTPGDFNSKSGKEALMKWERLNIIKKEPTEDNGVQFQLTEKGKFFVDALRNTPIPVLHKFYYIPRGSAKPENQQDKKVEEESDDSEKKT